jgi:hypothetical protein
VGYTTYNISMPQYIADPHSITRNTGRQIDWSLVPVSYAPGTDYTITVNQADVAAGDTSVTVDALPVALPAGTVLDFGSYDAVTVTIDDATTGAGDTSVGIASFTGFIPSGTLLDFGVDGSGNVQIVKLAADLDGTSSAVTTMTVVELAAAIVDASTATFPGGDIQAKLTASAAAAATTITVEPLPFAIANDATATYTENGGGVGKRAIKAGTVMAELSSGKVVPRADRPGSETSIGLLTTEALEDSQAAGLSGYGLIVGGVVYENLLPEASGTPATINATYKTELQTAGVGTGFAFIQYGDDRED